MRKLTYLLLSLSLLAPAGLPASSSFAVVQVTNAGSNSESQMVPVTGGKVVIDMPAESFVSVFAE